MAFVECDFASKFSGISLCADDELIRDFCTPWGKFSVAVQGDPRKSPLLTLHDVGLNYASNFKPFFNLPEVRLLAESFCSFHVNVPGQESYSRTVTTCPDPANLVLGLEYILRACGIRTFVGMGYGAGAFVLSMFALRNPDVVNGLIVVNGTAEAASWTEYGYFSMAAVALRSSGLTQSPLDFLRWYHCGCVNDNSDTSELVQSFDQRLSAQNPENLANWMFAYTKRKPLELARGSDGSGEKRNNFRCPVLIIVGRESPHVEPSRRMFAACDPRLATLLEIQDCRAPLDEAPMKVLQSVLYFLQGLGYPLARVRALFSKGTPTSSPVHSSPSCSVSYVSPDASGINITCSAMDSTTEPILKGDSSVVSGYGSLDS